MNRLPIFVCLILTLLTGSAAAQDVRAKPRPQDETDKFFNSGPVVRLRIDLAPDQWQKLQQNNREYVRCTISEEGGPVYKEVGIKLKGAAGSFRDLNDRPALTLNTDKYNKKQLFHGLEKFHLNNSVQDNSYLNEMLCSELFRSAGVPATRVAHARVWLNGRDLGLYVLKEGFDKRFIERHFAKADGNFYDGGFCQDIDAELEKDAGLGPDDRSDLRAIVEACREGDEKKRFERFAQKVDVDALATFVAMELLTCHWDGYARNVNNYRVYIEPTTKKAYFFPHGMDQMFGDTGTSVLDGQRGMASNVLLQNKLWRAKYLERLTELRPLFAPDKLCARVDELQRRLEPALKDVHPDQAREHAHRARELKERLTSRAQNLREQFAHFPLLFDKQGVAPLTDWYKGNASGDVKLEEVQLGGRTAYSIQVGSGGNSQGSWRRKVLLMKGNYRFEAQAATRSVVATGDEKGSAAGLRISGANRTDKIDGTSGGKRLTYDFAVNDDQREVELIAELKASQGQAWFATESLLLRRLDP